MDLSGAPRSRPTPITAARTVAKSIAKLDALLDELRPTSDEAHPDTPRGQAWAALVGSVVRATLRADEVVAAEEPFQKSTKRPFVRRASRTG